MAKSGELELLQKGALWGVARQLLAVWICHEAHIPSAGPRPATDTSCADRELRVPLPPPHICLSELHPAQVFPDPRPGTACRAPHDCM